MPTHLRTAAPFALAPADALKPDPWMLWRGETAVELPASIDNWDVATPITVTRKVAIDVDRLRRVCHLPNAVLNVAATWYASGTRLRGGSHAMELPTHGTQHECRIEVTAPGTELAGALRLSTLVVLAATPQDPHPLSASTPGSVLWRDSQETLLEGVGSRFPMEVIDFASTGWLPSGASWYFDLGHFDLEAPVLGSVRLLINRASTEVIAAVTTQDPGPQAQAVRDFIRLDTCRCLLRAGLRDPEFIERAEEYAEDSLGITIRRLARALFPDREFSELVDLQTEQPEQLETALQNALDVFANNAGDA